MLNSLVCGWVGERLRGSLRPRRQRAPSSAKRKRPYAFGDLLAADPRLVDLIELGTAADVCDAVLDAGLK